LICVLKVERDRGVDPALALHVPYDRQRAALVPTRSPS